MNKSIKVPLYIQKQMHKVAKLHNEARELTENIEKWLESKGVDYVSVGQGSLRSGDGQGLDELDYGNDVTDEIVERLEKGDY